LWAGARLTQLRTVLAARQVFLASVIYLPLLLLLMVADHPPTPVSTSSREPSASRPAALARVQATPLPGYSER
jgi:hypothetical protein